MLGKEKKKLLKSENSMNGNYMQVIIENHATC